jgi:hypothetical protein
LPATGIHASNNEKLPQNNDRIQFFNELRSQTLITKSVSHEYYFNYHPYPGCVCPDDNHDL